MFVEFSILIGQTVLIIVTTYTKTCMADAPHAVAPGFRDLIKELQNQGNAAIFGGVPVNFSKRQQIFCRFEPRCVMWRHQNVPSPNAHIDSHAWNTSTAKKVSFTNKNHCERQLHVIRVAFLEKSTKYSNFGKFWRSLQCQCLVICYRKAFRTDTLYIFSPILLTFFSLN